MHTKLGSSIIEVVIATAMISMAIIAALSLTSKSQSQSNYARRSSEASKYATQVSDWLRGERDNLGFAELASVPNGLYCLVSLPPDINSLPLAGDCGSNDLIDNLYQRSLILDSTSTVDTILATIEVVWQDSTTRSTKINLELTKW
jgi:type II secretory pathway pseudopilin PulG